MIIRQVLLRRVLVATIGIFFWRFNAIFWNQQYKVVDYCCVIFWISKHEATYILKILISVKKKCMFVIIEMNSKKIFYKWSKEKLSEYTENRYYLKNSKAKSKEYYKNNKGNWQDQAPNSYTNFSEEEKYKNRKYGWKEIQKKLFKEDKKT